MNDYSEYYTNRKPTGFGEYILSLWHSRMLRIATTFIPQLKHKSILEIGTGHGLFAAICRKNRITYYGYEMNTEQANSLCAAGYNVTPATIPPIPAGPAVNVIWLSHVLEHATNYREAREMLSACYNKLETDGYVVIIAPDIHHWKSEFWSVDWSHGFPTSLNRVEQLLNDTGFSIHKSMHHTCTLTNPILSWLISWMFRLLLPVAFIDFIFDKLLKRKFCSSFMSVFGLRQIYLIGKK